MKKYVTHFLFAFTVAMMLLATNAYAEETQEYVHTCNAGYLYGAEGGMIIEHCMRMTEGCDHEAIAVIEYPPFSYTETGEASFPYDGKEKNGASVRVDEHWQGELPVITYEDNVNAGVARAYATMTSTDGRIARAVYMFFIREVGLTLDSITAQGKVYDGTDKVNITNIDFSGVLDSDDVSVDYSGLQGKLSSSDAGTYDEITISVVNMKGEQGSNYAFTPGTYKLATPIVISKAENAPGMPESTMKVASSCKTVGDVYLPWGWKWSEEDKNKALIVGVAQTATAEYEGADKNNYETVQKQISITRSECKHAWDEGNITTKPTVLKKGIKTYTCTQCEAKKTEEIAALRAPAVGKKLESDDGKATYKITKSGCKNGTVEYVKPTDKKKSTVTVPAIVYIDGVTYKVTSIAANAFSKNIYIKNLTIGKNVSKIGVNAFYKCKNLKSIKISATKLTNKKVGSNAFYGIKSKPVIKVPKKKYNAYKKMMKAKGVGKKAKYKKF